MKLLAMVVVACVGMVITYLAMTRVPENWGWIPIVTIILTAIVASAET